MTSIKRTLVMTALVVLLQAAPAADAAPMSLELSATVRDFSSSHPDFGATVATDPGIVNGTLGAGRKPVYAGATGNPSTSGAA
ncbi:MAG: hypothetical protein KDK91_20785, partial [Gammaproteobacteria bacterium]|nr:hypothetical protein [Gammaproteobacteria bacterium]